MSTTPRSTAVMSESIATDTVELLLQPRRVYLKARAPKDRRVHQLRRDIGGGRAKPVHMLLAVTIADLHDGVPLSLALRPYEALIAVLTEYAEQVQAPRTSEAPALVNVADVDGVPVRSLLPLVNRELRAQTAFDAATNDVLANPDDVRALDAALVRSAEYTAECERMTGAIRQRRAALSLGDAYVPVAGGKR